MGYLTLGVIKLYISGRVRYPRTQTRAASGAPPVRYISHKKNRSEISKVVGEISHVPEISHSLRYLSRMRYLTSPLGYLTPLRSGCSTRPVRHDQCRQLMDGVLDPITLQPRVAVPVVDDANQQAFEADVSTRGRPSAQTFFDSTSQDVACQSWHSSTIVHEAHRRTTR